ncbi:MAG: GNAT family N-acetyltransferase [Rhodospirillaceae bacterium]|nr:GNAT family N-acetyltransferase [Rhodospirillaceae bacterium]
MGSRSLRRSVAPRDWVVRYAEPAEFDDVAALLLRANAQYRADMPPGIFRAYRENLRALALDPGQQEACEILVVGAADGGLRGTVSLFPDAASEELGWPKGWAGLRALAVDPAARGHGLGRRLIEAAISRARAIGAPILALHNAPFQAAARRLYLDLGFTRCPQYDFDVGDMPGIAGTGERMRVEALTLNLR